MKGFVDEIKAQVPGATFINDQTNGLNTSYDPATTYDKAKAFITANPTVQFIQNVDIGAEHIDKAITDLSKVGSIYTIGWNVSLAQLDAIDKGNPGCGSRPAMGGAGSVRRHGLRELLRDGHRPPQHARP